MSELPPLLEARRETLERLAREHSVRRFEVFGSVSEASAGPGSDVDFLVEFDPAPPAVYAARYFALLEALETLFGRSVDLIETKEITNPYFLESIKASRVLLYAA